MQPTHVTDICFIRMLFIKNYVDPGRPSSQPSSMPSNQPSDEPSESPTGMVRIVLMHCCSHERVPMSPNVCMLEP